MVEFNKHDVRSGTNVAFGLKGFDEVSGTKSAPAKGWFMFKAFNGNATLSATCDYGDNLSSGILQNGDNVHGNFSAVAVTSGLVLAYRN